MVASWWLLSAIVGDCFTVLGVGDGAPIIATWGIASAWVADALNVSTAPHTRRLIFVACRSTCVMLLSAFFLGVARHARRIAPVALVVSRSSGARALAVIQVEHVRIKPLIPVFSGRVALTGLRNASDRAAVGDPLAIGAAAVRLAAG